MASKRNAQGDAGGRSSKMKRQEDSSLSVATYNVWFGYDGGDPHGKKRMEALVEALIGGDSIPILVGFQEVTSDLEPFLRPSLQSVGYRLVTQESFDPRTSYGCAIAYQEGVCNLLESGWEGYGNDTGMGRGLLWLKVGYLGKEILFSTTHLESFVKGEGNDGAQQRAQQVRRWKTFCEAQNQDLAIVTGDLNWDDERKRSSGKDKPLSSLLSNSWLDAWRTLYPKDDGYTYDSKENPMLRGNLRRRFDRVLILPSTKKGSDSSFKLASAEMFGKEAIAGLTFQKAPNPYTRAPGPTVPVAPSDHFGLRVTLKSNSDN